MSVSLLMLIVSRMSAKKYCRLFEFLCQGVDYQNSVKDIENMNFNSQNQGLMNVLSQQFDKYDMDTDGYIQSDALQAMLNDAARVLYGSEKAVLAIFFLFSFVFLVTF